MKYILIAFLSAMLFGASTPIGKLLLDSLSSFQLAGLLYLGAAIGTLPFLVRKSNPLKISNLDGKNIFRLSGAISLGGVTGPVLLLLGLQIASAASVAMWLNLELVFTAILGFILFQDYLGLYGWIGIVGTLTASVFLSWNEEGIGLYALLFVGGATICWGLDNHLTALIDGITPAQSTFWKGTVAGFTNLMISVLLESYGKEMDKILLAIIVGIFAYGFSISLYILAAQNLGATRSQMIFASAPFFGVIIAVFLLGENISTIQIVAALVLILSLITLFRDQHDHFHTHVPLNHTHKHRHDDKHHNHSEEKGYHTHEHKHSPITHKHPHWPDLHHRHSH